MTKTEIANQKRAMKGKPPLGHIHGPKRIIHAAYRTFSGRAVLIAQVKKEIKHFQEIQCGHFRLTSKVVRRLIRRKFTELN